MVHDDDRVDETAFSEDGDHTPIWRRVTAALSLGAMVVLGAVVLAALVGLALLIAVFVLERAIGGGGA
ncbi:MAG: hypothetical protein ACK5PP_07030 [Acidimicrobiales bacterium]